ncbi:MAG: hypothetical protein IT438_04005 [Phycisphaerales bacterium]|nr:hypothetical protein [Phycisphaerales bacterium]
MITSISTGRAAPKKLAVHRLTPMIHVADVERSVRFYALLGIATGDCLRDHAGRAFWAGMGEREARIMFAAASGPVVPEDQAVILYLYAPDVAALRTHLLASGLHDGGRYTGCAGPNGGRSVAFEITRPDYMPAGEFRIADPDGYCLLIGQLGTA